MTRYFLQEAVKVSVPKAKLWNVICLRGVTDENKPYIMYVKGFTPSFVVNIDGWEPKKIDTFKSYLKDINHRITFGYEAAYPTWFNKNQRCNILRIFIDKVRTLKDAMAHPIAFADGAEKVDLHGAEFDAANQFLFQKNLRLQSWFTVSENVRLNTYQNNLMMMWSPGALRLVEEDDSLVHNVGYIRMRAVSVANKGVKPYGASVECKNDYISAVSVVKEGGEKTFCGDDEETVLREMHAYIDSCDTLILLEDNYPAVELLCRRLKKYKLGLSKVGRGDWLRTDNDGTVKCTIKGRTVLNMQAGFMKEQAASKLEAHTIKDFSQHNYFYGKGKKPQEHMAYSHQDATMQTPEESGVETMVEARLLKKLVEHTDQITKAAAVSKLCDQPLDKVVHGGQQMRVFRILARECHERGFFIDSTFYKKFRVIEPSSAKTTFRKIHEHWVRKFCDMDSHERGKVRQRLKNAAKKKFKGGYVHDPVPGFYEFLHIFCCDFSALYPSIIIAYVLCYASVVYNKHYRNSAELEADPDIEVEYISISDDICVPVVKSYKGERPITVYDHMIAKLLAARVATKKRMKQASKELDAEQIDMDNASSNDAKVVAKWEKTIAKLHKDPKDAEVLARALRPPNAEEIKRLSTLVGNLNALQLAQKVTANAAYGFLGTSDEKEVYACNPLSAIVTAYGRYMNIQVAEMFLRPMTPEMYDMKPEDYTPEDLLKVGFGGTIRYGDTDSVILNFPEQGPYANEDAREAAQWKFAMYACAVASRMFPAPNELECEADYMCLMLFRDCDTTGSETKLRTGGIRKKYICMKRDFPGGPVEIKVQGNGAKRRDNCMWARDTTNEVIDMIWVKKDRSLIMPYLHDRMKELVTYKVPINDLTITCRMRGHYDNENLVQALLKKKLLERDGRRVKEGERIPFVYVTGPKVKGKNPIYTEHPSHLKIAKRPVKLEYYLTQLRGLIVPLVQEFPELRASVLKFFPIYNAIARGTKMSMPKRTDTASTSSSIGGKRPLKRPMMPPPKRIRMTPSKPSSNSSGKRSLKRPMMPPSNSGGKRPLKRPMMPLSKRNK